MSATAPDILSLRRDGACVQLQLHIPSGLTYFDGHFDGLPLLPGVVQVDWAIRLARAHFTLPERFRRLSALKFMRVIRPGTETPLHLRWEDAVGELSFRYGSEDAPYSSGRILFTPA